MKNEQDAEPKDIDHRTPVGAGSDSLLDHEYDGIREFDNPLPAWWKNVFWATFVFAIAYVLWFHVRGDGQPVMTEYQAAMSAWEKQQEKMALANPITEETLSEAMHSEATISAGAEIFSKECTMCHGASGEGKIGPNLTDGHWLHGEGRLMDIHQVVKNGVTGQMPAWEKKLGPGGMRKVVAYVGTLRNTNKPGKEPQGKPVQEN